MLAVVDALCRPADMPPSFSLVITFVPSPLCSRVCHTQLPLCCYHEINCSRLRSQLDRCFTQLVSRTDFFCLAARIRGWFAPLHVGPCYVSSFDVEPYVFSLGLRFSTMRKIVFVKAVADKTRSVKSTKLAKYSSSVLIRTIQKIIQGGW